MCIDTRILLLELYIFIYWVCGSSYSSVYKSTVRGGGGGVL